MKISSISPNFQGRRDNIDAAINLDDNSIKQLAFIKTKSESNYKNERKISNALIYSAPLAAGIAHTVLSKEKEAKIFSKTVKNLAARSANGLKIAGLWTVGLASLEVLGSGMRKLRENSTAYRKFDNNYPLTSLVAGIAGAFGLLTLIDKGAGMLSEVKAPKFMQNATAKAEKFINSNKNLKNVRKFLSENIAVLPKSMKSAGKFVLRAAAPALIISGVFSGVKANYKFNKEYNQNYMDLKDAQSHLAKARLKELEIQHDILMQNEQNREDLALIDNPTEGLSEEVLAKIDKLHEEA